MDADQLLDWPLMDQMVTEGFVSARRHESADLTIYNYTQRAQYNSVWNEATLHARGLIVAGSGELIARPFRKFFNLSQLEAVPKGEPTFHEKLDGSLGIAYPLGDYVRIATRGSFASDQAQWATDWLHAHPEHHDFAADAIVRDYTPLFEIIYPENRIVVEYGDRAELVLLTCIDNQTGLDVVLDGWPGSTASTVELSLAALAQMDDSNSEGFVLRWPCGTRAKYKFPNYVRLHKLLTGVNTRTIWELLANDQSLDELLDLVPDEFYDWVHLTVANLNHDYEIIVRRAVDVLDAVDRSATRREQAEFITANSTHPGIVFAMLDGKNYAEKVWKLVRPERAIPFTSDPDESVSYRTVTTATTGGTR